MTPASNKALGITYDMAELIAVLVALLGAYAAYHLGLAAYVRQKEFENVRTRYLDNGVELTCSHVDCALGVCGLGPRGERRRWAYGIYGALRALV
jgi:hypothetical protein